MNAFTTIVAICCLSAAARARPGVGHTGLHGIPDLQTFGGITYPKNDIIHLGEYSKGFLPGDEIHESKYVTIKEPQPYPVKIPVPHPYPVQVAKPYPVVQTKYVKVPYRVPYEVVKHVPVPVEVPKPYPVQVHGDSYGAGSAQAYGIQGVHGGVENYGSSDQNSNYETQEHSDDGASAQLEQGAGESQDWAPSEGDSH